ncbi:ATP-dependent RNA helicase DEAH13 isoform X1 [Selaginella moellendorffii]|uniref:ATP-dependent RNA helicase DEAH13 isoform X1 n=2 Tax=Selaginella moellendorffii TaxID=88036 RepID=UPI000D1C6D76|nr:ATP-dependent RNA helicase DEAH13 isoform X1 [Selaginella moellendorffii]|eukprot:XP_024524561.1 ATP-dependent RNA helicase DEAH13 isoform X1 [Selaginella moellendorffii]
MKKKRGRSGDGAGAGADSNAIEMPAKRKKNKESVLPSKPDAGRISKSMQRKLKKLQEEKEKRELREQAFETLENYKLSDNVQALMSSSSALGKAETMREKLRRGMQLRAAGLDVPPEIPLFRERIVSKDDSVVEPGPAVTAKTEKVHNKTKRTDFCQSVIQDGGNSQAIKESCANAEGTDISLSLAAVASASASNTRKFVVNVWRSEEVDKSRRELPIIMMEQEVMEAVQENDVVIICGETGCGKTTQVPQFLYEAGYGSPLYKDRCGIIGITQPRRIAVLTTAKRVAHELNLQLGKEVGFQVRHDRKIGEKSSIKFMTDGILLREIQSDFLLTKYSVIVLDEAHERSVNTDILVGMLSRVLPLRNRLYFQNKRSEAVTPLKLIIMSATLRVEDFTANQKMFRLPPPVIHVTARQFPVTVHSSRKTELQDYESAAYRKVCAIHRKLPPGGILVFVTGRREVEALCKRLRLSFTPSSKLESSDGKPVAKREDSALLSGTECGALDMRSVADAVDEEDDDSSDWEEDVDGFTGENDSSSSGVSDVEDTDKTPGNETSNMDHVRKPGPALVLPLYAMLPAEAQLRVFAAVPEGKRLIVVATNVAETSITIPGIRYVVDCGRAKERKFDGSSGVSRFEVGWISKASADQRAGRAGRTGPGHCYQLYSKTHYHHNFPDFAPPEISLVPIEGVVLVLKCMGIDKVMNFPFPTPPEKGALLEAEKCLTALSALDRTTGLPTSIGKAMALYPINPRHARMVIAALQSARVMGGKSRKSVIAACAVAIAAALSVENPFFSLEESSKDEKDAATTPSGEAVKATKKPERHRFKNTSSDALTIMNALRAYEESSNQAEFCTASHLNQKIMKEMSKLRGQLSRLVRQQLLEDLLIGSGLEEGWKQLSRKKLSTNEEKALIYALCAGWPDRVARRVTRRDRLDTAKSRKRGIRYQASSLHGQEDGGDEEGDGRSIVYLGPSSSTFSFASDFVVYKEIVETSRPYMACVSSIDAHALVTEASFFCSFSRPLDDPPPWYDREADQVKCWVSATFGPHNWQLPLHAMELPAGRKTVAVFASALLEGRVLASLAPLRQYLAADPAMLLKPEAMAHKRVAELVYKLEEGWKTVVDSRRKLAEAWDDGEFLVEEIAAWIQRKHQGLLRTLREAVKSELDLRGTV